MNRLLVGLTGAGAGAAIMYIASATWLRWTPTGRLLAGIASVALVAAAAPRHQSAA